MSQFSQEDNQHRLNNRISHLRDLQLLSEKFQKIDVRMKQMFDDQSLIDTEQEIDNL